MIETQAFQGLPDGTVVFIPGSVSSIASDAFDADIVIVTSFGSYAAQWGKEHGMQVIEE